MMCVAAIAYIYCRNQSYSNANTAPDLVSEEIVGFVFRSLHHGFLFQEQKQEKNQSIRFVYSLSTLTMTFKFAALL